MKEEQPSMMNYEAPQVEIIEVEIEKGYAASDPTGIGNGFGSPS